MLGTAGVGVPLVAPDEVGAAGASGFLLKRPPLKRPPLGAAGAVFVEPASAGFGGAAKKLDAVDPVVGVA